MGVWRFGITASQREKGPGPEMPLDEDLGVLDRRFARYKTVTEKCSIKTKVRYHRQVL